jgi:GNAT superfamily N-acetyltransferase
MNKKSFSIRRFRLSDVPEVVRLFELAFELPFSSEWWNWKYRLNPAGFSGEEGDVWIAENAKKEIVGHWAVIPEKMKIGSKTVTVAQAVDAATHPEYRRRGIFKTLVKKVCSDAADRYSFVFGYPDEIIHKSYLKLGWKDYQLVECYKFLNYDRPFRSLFTSDFLAWLGKVGFKTLRIAKCLSPSVHFEKLKGAPVEIQKVEQFPSEIDDFWRKARLEFEAVLERTSTFLNWRFSKYFGNYQIYIARSIENKSIIGYIVLRKTKTEKIANILDIVDLNALPGEDKCMLSLINNAVTLADKEGLDIVHCRIPQWHEYADILCKIGFVSVNRMFHLMKMYQPRLILYRYKEKGKMPKMHKLYYTLADTDDA